MRNGMMQMARFYRQVEGSSSIALVATAVNAMVADAMAAGDHTPVGVRTIGLSVARHRPA
jgi:hypothetical protein